MSGSGSSAGASDRTTSGVFADGKPVDKTYRSRPVVSDDDAPEALGVASGYKPEVDRQAHPEDAWASEEVAGQWRWCSS